MGLHVPPLEDSWQYEEPVQEYWVENEIPPKGAVVAVSTAAVTVAAVVVFWTLGGSADSFASVVWPYALAAICKCKRVRENVNFMIIGGDFYPQFVMIMCL
mmetsp:Transcript_824/g.1579  ORF Transcript_824/g.1579 Transcript_824/m.1579 type:complete len:101 (-) Transcript_824:17-319(-)